MKAYIELYKRSTKTLVLQLSITERMAMILEICKQEL